MRFFDVDVDGFKSDIMYGLFVADGAYLMTGTSPVCRQAATAAASSSAAGDKASKKESSALKDRVLAQFVRGLDRVISTPDSRCLRGGIRGC